jgi:hypothetical protein
VGQYDSWASRTLVLLLRNGQWFYMPTPNDDGEVAGIALENALYGVAIASPTNAWAVGVSTDYAFGTIGRPLILERVKLGNR